MDYAFFDEESVIVSDFVSFGDLDGRRKSARFKKTYTGTRG